MTSKDLGLKSRWSNESFQLVRQFILNTGKFSSVEYARDWYETQAPKLQHSFFYNEKCVDCRGVDLQNMEFDQAKELAWYILDEADFQMCTFKKTTFYASRVFHANFRNSRFEQTQMCPFYAHAADFSGCTFETCLAFGNSPIKEPYGYYNDFSECNFNHVRANDSSFHTCDFRKADLSNSRFINCELSYSLFNGANLTQAYFENCTFTDGYAEIRDIRCDFRGCNLEGVQFVACDFLHAKFDATPLARAAVAAGNNLNCETIAWEM